MNVYIEYFLLAFLCFLGLFQLAASFNRLSGLSFFRSTFLGYLFATIAVLGAFCWFYLAKDRCVQGVEGVESFLLLVGAAPLALLVTASVSSLVNRGLRPPTPIREHPEESGIDALRTMTYFQLIARYLRERKKG